MKAALEFVVSPVLRAVAQARADEEHVAVLDEGWQREPEFLMRNNLRAAAPVYGFAVHTPCKQNKAQSCQTLTQQYTPQGEVKTVLHS